MPSTSNECLDSDSSSCHIGKRANSPLLLNAKALNLIAMLPRSETRNEAPFEVPFVMAKPAVFTTVNEGANTLDLITRETSKNAESQL